MSAFSSEDADLSRIITHLKDRIGREPSWDDYKTRLNPYENVYSLSPWVSTDSGRRSPISRAFYKLWEMFHESPQLVEVLRDGRPMRVAYLAEGPGSFIQSMVEMRGSKNLGGRDAHFGVTLHAKQRSVPSWKLAESWTRKHNVHLYSGDGDLCKESVRERFVCGVGAGSCTLVTADGGFDFSSDFNSQESQMIRLIAAECLTASRLLCRGGNAIVKIFDVFDPCTIAVLGRFARMFDSVSVVKPMTSRPANSERYLQCINYNPGLANENAPDLLVVAEGGTIEPDGSDRERYIRAQCRAQSIRQASHIIEVLDHIDRDDRRVCDDRSREWVDRYRPDRHTPLA